LEATLPVEQKRRSLAEIQLKLLRRRPQVRAAQNLFGDDGKSRPGANDEVAMDAFAQLA
jgi:hypothetical protein